MENLELTKVYAADVSDIDIDETAELEIEKNMASKNHARIQSRLAKMLNVQYDENFDIYTEFEIELLEKRVIPDLSIYPIEPSDWKNDVIRGDTAPLLAIEILSPRQAFNDITDKIHTIYFPSGMASVWVVLPPVESIMVFKPNQKTQTFNEGLLKDAASGFEVDLDKVFR